MLYVGDKRQFVGRLWRTWTERIQTGIFSGLRGGKWKEKKNQPNYYWAADASGADRTCNFMSWGSYADNWKMAFFHKQNKIMARPGRFKRTHRSYNLPFPHNFPGMLLFPRKHVDALGLLLLARLASPGLVPFTKGSLFFFFFL